MHASTPQHHRHPIHACVGSLASVSRRCDRDCSTTTSRSQSTTTPLKQISACPYRTPKTCSRVIRTYTTLERSIIHASLRTEQQNSPCLRRVTYSQHVIDCSLAPPEWEGETEWKARQAARNGCIGAPDPMRRLTCPYRVLHPVLLSHPAPCPPCYHDAAHGLDALAVTSVPSAYTGSYPKKPMKTRHHRCTTAANCAHQHPAPSRVLTESGPSSACTAA